MSNSDSKPFCSLHTSLRLALAAFFERPDQVVLDQAGAFAALERTITALVS